MSFSPRRSNWLRNLLQVKELTHIVDVGSNPVEPVPYQDLLRDGGCRLTGFEPQEEAFAKLEKIKGENETYHQFAVGDGKTRTLYLTQHDTLTSFYKGNMASCGFLGRFGENIKIVDQIELETVALDQSSVIDFHLLKIDVQGGEVIVFDGAKDKLSRAVAVIPEVRWYEIYKGEPMFAGIDMWLRSNGFALHKFLFNKAKSLPNSQYDLLRQEKFENQLIDGDAVYIKDFADLKKYNIEEAKHLAILADGVWFSFDLVLRILDILTNSKAIPEGSANKYAQLLPKELLKNTS